MFCPNCGANNSTEQSFCRACGLNLEKTADSLLEQIPSAESAKLLKRARNLEKFGNVAFGGLCLLGLTAIGGLIYAVVAGLILSGKQPLVGIFLTAFIIFAVLTLIYVVLRENLKERRQEANPILQKEIEAKDTAKLLEEKPFEPIPSITENTTELIYAEKLKPKTSGDLINEGQHSFKAN